MKQAVPHFQASPKGNVRQLPYILFFFLALSSSTPFAEFTLNFQPNSNVVTSVANINCNNSGGGGMMGDGMMGGGMDGMGTFGPGCPAGAFMQELVNDAGTQYYHVILGDPSQDAFAMEFYIRNGGCCWWSGGGMMGGGGMGGMGGGDAPFSSSYGDTSNATANAFTPLAAPGISGTGTGNPSRVYMIQINNDPEMNQQFEKRQEANKPRIIQTINDGSAQLDFDLNMSNGGYGSYTTPAQFDNRLTLNQPLGLGDFDMATDAPQRDSTAGQYRYSAGSGHGGSYGSYTYQGTGFDVYNTDWLSYCDPAQNPDFGCTFSTGGGGGGMMGM